MHVNTTPPSCWHHFQAQGTVILGTMVLGHTRGGLGEDPALHQWSLANPEFYSRRGGGGGLFFRLPPDDAALLRGYDPSGGVLPPVPTPPVFPSTCSSLNSVL